MESNTKQWTVRLALLVSLSGLLIFLKGPATAAPAVPANNPNWGAVTQMSNLTHGARKPVIRYSPDGSRLILAYNQWLSSNGTTQDPYYRISTNGGQSWLGNQAPIRTTAPTSVSVTAAFDSQNRSHAVWVEQAGSTWSLVSSYKNAAAANWTAPLTISSITVGVGSPIVADPSLTVGANDTLYVVWAEADTSLGESLNIHYTRSTNRGVSWSAPEEIADTGPNSLEPAVAVDELNRVHVVWQEETLSGNEILYARRTGSGWSTIPIQVSPDPVENPPEAYTLPTIAAVGNRVHIAFTKFQDNGDKQDVYYTNCTNACNSQAKVNAKNVSGTFVSVNGSDPFFLAPDIAYHNSQKAPYIYFHGDTAPGVPPANELVLGVNSCDNWSASPEGRDQVTSESIRAIDPTVTIYQNQIKLVYDRVTSQGEHQIYYVGGQIGCHKLYLPTIVRN